MNKAALTSRRLNNAQNILATIVDINSLLNVTDTRNKRLFYNLCSRYINQTLFQFTKGNMALATVQTVLDSVISAERMFFSKSNVLNIIVNFLTAHSDGDNLQCMINLKLLDYFLHKYY
ncbi:ac19-like protein [Cryptophlebia peltastica nucleopolyhedrovirus]|uniref:Ac19-like protein n=1 Tax=Cryptophlebia peltastica nucleopolyhedrovirus TaxID=2304025 RepID=A0A346RNY0_9ABAC|nr:ac19-like protein [Cryptophlebia peltastica nucleopolyhedrovirus]AXS67777.1 ac19-like protein [Cryptophlebia peltastica nucleopolyhedrovirus]